MTKLAAYVAVLAAAFAAAFALGSSASPLAAEPKPAHEDTAMAGADLTGEHDPHGADDAAVVPGLAVSQDGFTLVPGAATLPQGSRVPFAFTVVDAEGRPVTDYAETHEKRLHLIVVRRDLSGFQHLHPTLEADGTWTVPLDVSAAGTYRVFADFQPAGADESMTLGVDVAVGGAYRPVTLPAAATRAPVDGYVVTLGGHPVAGEESELVFTVSKGGDRVSDLQPYLGAFGHLVSLRTGDLAYLHTHPAGRAEHEGAGGPDIRFATTFPTAGTYRLFLDFRVADEVRTAEFTVIVGADDEH